MKSVLRYIAKYFAYLEGGDGNGQLFIGTVVGFSGIAMLISFVIYSVVEAIARGKGYILDAEYPFKSVMICTGCAVCIYSLIVVYVMRTELRGILTDATSDEHRKRYVRRFRLFLIGIFLASILISVALKA